MLVVLYLKKNTQTLQFGVAPWFPDGSINPHGVAYGRRDDMFCPKDRQIIEESKESGWECRRCEKWISIRPQQYQGAGDEPATWWWCNACKTTAVQPKTIQEKRRAAAAVGCQTIGKMWNKSTHASNA
jgi:hypothetical protein